MLNVPNTMNVAVFDEKLGHMPAAASDGNGYLIVWDAKGTVFGLALDEGGRPVGQRVEICDPPHGSGAEAAVVYVEPKGAYYVVWENIHGSARGAFVGKGQQMPTGGTALDGPPPPPYMPHNNRSAAASCSGGMTLVAWMTEYQDVRGVHVDASGKVLDPNPIQIPLGGPKQLPAGWHSVAAFDAELFLVARDAILTHRVIGTAFVQGGKVWDGPLAPGGPRPYVGQFNSAACSGRFETYKPGLKHQVLLVWTSGSAAVPGSLAELRGARVDRTGKLLDANGFDIHPTGGEIPAIACDGKRYLVAWKKGKDVQAIFVDPGGNVAPGGGTRLWSGTSSRLAAASNGKNFLVVWDRGWAIVS